MKKFAIDRIVESIAICECLQTAKRLEIEIKNLPDGVKESDVLHQRDDGVFVMDAEFGTQKTAEMTARLNKLFMN